MGKTLQTLYKRRHAQQTSTWTPLPARITETLLSGRKEIPTFVFLPYFLGGKLLAALPSMRMTDYQVNYTNHPNYKAKAAGKKGSPVRLFTNVSLAHIKLPKKEGYRFCKPCERFSSIANKHCFKCKTCPSQDGSTWVRRCRKLTHAIPTQAACLLLLSPASGVISLDIPPPMP